MGNKPINDRLLRALKLEPVDQTPVWVMRQAGRYLPEYQLLRSEAPDFMAFCRTPELAAQATLQPLGRFPLDAAIVFSDILTIPDAMGCPVSFVQGHGPVLENPIIDEDALNNLTIPHVEEELRYVAETVSLASQKIENHVPLIGFSGSPWTVACYMVEGGSSKLFLTIKRMVYKNPEMLHELLEKITKVTINYLIMQADAGANVLMVFDSWGGILTPSAYRSFSLNYLRQIAAALKANSSTANTPLIFFSKQAHHAYADLAQSGCQGIGVDWTINLGQVRKQLGDAKVALQGNLDPAILLSSPHAIQLGVQDVLDAYGDQPGHIFNLGHGIDKDTPIEHVAVMVDTVQTISRERFKKDHNGQPHE